MNNISGLGFYLRSIGTLDFIDWLMISFIMVFNKFIKIIPLFNYSLSINIINLLLRIFKE
jgi:hypothetical protein